MDELRGTKEGRWRAFLEGLLWLWNREANLVGDEAKMNGPCDNEKP
jgi:hypothetical protein